MTVATKKRQACCAAGGARRETCLLGGRHAGETPAPQPRCNWSRAIWGNPWKLGSFWEVPRIRMGSVFLGGRGATLEKREGYGLEARKKSAAAQLAGKQGVDFESCLTDWFWRQGTGREAFVLASGVVWCGCV